MLTHRLLLASPLLLLTACTVIVNGRIEDAVDCDGLPDGTVCGTEIDDGVARECRANICVETGCADGGVCDLVDTFLTSQPSAVSGPDATFQFDATDPNATFECRLDGASFAACTSPQAFTGLTSGEHVFRVRARVGSTVDQTPATLTWTVDADILDTTITSGPGAVSGRDVTFEFTGNQAVSFECQLAPDENVFTACTSPLIYSDLAAMGAQVRTFSVRAVGADSARDDTPATQAFTVDGAGPTVVVNGSPGASATVNTTGASFTFAPAVAEANVTYRCRFNAEATFTDCTAGFSRTRLVQGLQVLRVIATDGVGNDGPELAHSWMISFLQTSIFAIRTTNIAEGTRVRIRGTGTEQLRSTVKIADRFWAQETDGSTNPNFRGITVIPTTFPADPTLGMGTPIAVVGTVAIQDTNLVLVDAEYTLFGSPGNLAVDPRSTSNDVLLTNLEENEGLYVGTGGKWTATQGLCAFGGSHIETCENGDVAHACPIFENGSFPDQAGNNRDFDFAGVIEGTSLGFRYRVFIADERSDVCL